MKWSVVVNSIPKVTPLATLTTVSLIRVGRFMAAAIRLAAMQISSESLPWHLQIGNRAAAVAEAECRRGQGVDAFQLNVRFGSKADIRRDTHLRPLSGVKQTLHVRFSPLKLGR